MHKHVTFINICRQAQKSSHPKESATFLNMCELTDNSKIKIKHSHNQCHSYCHLLILILFWISYVLLMNGGIFNCLATLSKHSFFFKHLLWGCLYQIIYLKNNIEIAICFQAISNRHIIDPENNNLQ